MRADLLALLERVRGGEARAREELVEANLRLVWSIVHRFAGRGYELDDLFQVGCLGLLKAIDRFDPSRGVQFSTYAVPLILGEIRTFLRGDSELKVERAQRELGQRVCRRKEELAQEWGREPSLAELAADLRLEVAEVVAALDALRPALSLAAPAAPCGEEEGPELEETLQGSEGFELATVEHLALRQVLAQLKEKERRVILLRFFAEKSQTEIARLLGLSQAQVSRLEKQALARLRALVQ
ncbi:MAG: SigB/SigF/SigG family RNA polymerase sigma factor [Bacillota bacterium]|nr:SigB/SigF/SigG family RNA polymerase sigma factor [Bacillota bacterium]